MIRGHEVINEGHFYSFGEDANFVTLFTAPNYANTKNKTSGLFIDEDCKYTFKSFRPIIEKVNSTLNQTNAE